MMFEDTPAERLTQWKAFLATLVFAQVKYVNAQDEDVFSFECSETGISGELPDVADFRMQKAKLTPMQWQNAKKCYHQYYGFARSGCIEYFFNKKGQIRHPADTASGLGIATDQRGHLTPPRRDDWIVGRKGQSDARLPKPPIQDWGFCTPQEKIFTDYILGYRTINPKTELLELQIGKGDDADLTLVILARILILKDVDYFLEARKERAQRIDWKVRNISEAYTPEFWTEYEEKARAQRIYSDEIPAPAPKPIVERVIPAKGAAPQVGINTPFARLAA